MVKMKMSLCDSRYSFKIYRILAIIKKKYLHCANFISEILNFEIVPRFITDVSGSIIWRKPFSIEPMYPPSKWTHKIDHIYFLAICNKNSISNFFRFFYILHHKHVQMHLLIYRSDASMRRCTPSIFPLF